MSERNSPVGLEEGSHVMNYQGREPPSIGLLETSGAESDPQATTCKKQDLSSLLQGTDSANNMNDL